MNSNNTLSNVERRDEILRFIQSRQRISVAEICEKFKVSEATARRDLDMLAEQQVIQRVHGGAISVKQAAPEPPILQRSQEQAHEKQRIGAKAAELIEDGTTLFMGSGTTVFEVARHLRNHRNLVVITNSLLVIEALSDCPDITLICLGGVFRPSELSFIGHLTEQALRELRPKKVVMGIRAISLTHGLTNDYIPEVSTDRVIIQSAPEIILVADHTKFDTISTAVVAPLTSIHKIVTDTQAPQKMVAELRNMGIDVIQA